jgi:hypothetical protein
MLNKTNINFSNFSNNVPLLAECLGLCPDALMELYNRNLARSFYYKTYKQIEKGEEPTNPGFYFNMYMSNLKRRMGSASQIIEPRKRIDKLLPLVREAIDMKVPKNCYPWWQLDYYLDRITGAMTKTRQYGEGSAITLEYFNIPGAEEAQCLSSVKNLRERALRQASLYWKLPDNERLLQENRLSSLQINLLNKYK